MTLLTKLLISLLSITCFVAIIMSGLFIYQTLSVGHNNQLAVQIAQAFFTALIVIWLSLYGLWQLSFIGSAPQPLSSEIGNAPLSSELEPAYVFYTWMFVSTFIVASLIVFLFSILT